MQHLCQFTKNNSGAVTMVFAVVGLLIVGAAGAAVDYSRAVNARSILQSALDTAVLAAAREADNTRATRDAAERIFEANFGGRCDTNLRIQVRNGEVDAVAECDINTPLIGALGISNLTIRATSRAAFVGGVTQSNASTCFYVLETSNANAFLKNGPGSVDSECGIQVNSTANTAFLANSGAVLSPEICVVGDSICNAATCRILNTGCDPKPDPLISFSAPTTGTCDFNNYLSNSFGSVILTPGVYCGDTQINGASSVTFEPGLYVIRDGQLLTNGPTSWTGNGITFRLEGSGRITKNGDGNVQISAPQSGPYTGILVYEAPGATGDLENILNGTGRFYAEGTFYTPNQDFKSNGVVDQNNAAPWTLFVVRNFLHNGTGLFYVRSDFDASSVPIPPAFTAENVNAIAIVD